MKKRILAMVICLMMIVGLTACGTDKSTNSASNPSTANSANGKVKFAVMFGVGGLGDNAFNDEVYEGCQMAEKEFGATFDYCEPTDVSEFETQLRAYADAGEYDVIMGISTEIVDAFTMVAEDYPDQKFCMLDASIEGFDNIHCLTASHPEQHFLSGVLAGIATQDERFELSNPENILGFCIAMDTPTSRSQASGFLAGARYINPDVEIFTTFIGSYSDPSTAKEQATTMYDRGADIISTNSGSSATGVFSAAAEQNHYVIGTALGMVDADHSLATSMKYIQQFVVAEIRALSEDTWEAGTQVYGIADGVCDYSLEGINTNVPDDVIEKLESIKALIVDGSLKLPTDLDQVDDWAAENQYKA